MTFVPYNIPVSVKGIVFEDGKVWLRKNNRQEWELPGGKLDRGEQPIQTVIREIQEELGFDVTPVDLIQAHVHHVESQFDEKDGVLVVSYLCRLDGKSGDFEHISETGHHAEFQSFTPEDVTNLNLPQFYKEAIAVAWQVEQERLAYTPR